MKLHITCTIYRAALLFQFGDVSKLSSDMVFQPLQVGKEYVYDLEKGKRFYITHVAIGQVRLFVHLVDHAFSLTVPA